MKKVLITGASSGIGRQLSIDLSSRGYKVIACARSSKLLEELREKHGVEPLVLDVTQKTEVVDKLRAIKDIDIVILNAGNCEYVDVESFESGAFERVFQVNFMGVVYAVEALSPYLKRGSQLMIVDSLSRLLPFTRAQAYGASKAALYYFTKSLEVDLSSRGVLVQSISPGFVKTPLTDKNDFPMPFLISVEEASRRIVYGLESKSTSIAFPRRLWWLLSFLSLLPPSVQKLISSKMKNNV